LRAGDEGFVGISAAAGMLPDVAGLTDKAGRRRFGEEVFPDWQSLLDHWRSAIAEIAGEVRDGVAAVAVIDEAALAYCEVKPLLRLAERRDQLASTT
jgi:exodeoxyribonuclease-5